MALVSDDRLAAAREVVSMIRGSSDFREGVAANPAGERPILVASVDDTVGEVMGRISRTGLPVTLCVRAGSSSMTVATIRGLEAGEHGGDVHSVAPKVSLGMFISYLWKTGAFTFHVEAPVGAEYELEFA